VSFQLRLGRLLHPVLLRLWMRFARDREMVTNIHGIQLVVPPTVFHPRFFGSSRIFADYLLTLDLAGKRFLDLGTGSGIIGLVSSRAGATVTAVDVNARAVECAGRNAARAGLRLDCRVSDLFSAVRGEQFDIVAWNPPFFPKPAKNVAEAALFAGENHSTIRRFAAEVRRYLAPGGRVFLILSEDLDLVPWREIFGTANFRLMTRFEQCWVGEKMMVIEAV
jgi:methylase of polypeptide subunit release factors